MAKRNIAALAAGTVQSAGLENISRGAGLAGMLQFGGAVLPNARLLPLDRLDLNPYQARQHFDETALAELTDSVREYGVLEPILVRPVAGDRFEILAGERRYRAAVAAGRDTIPAVIHHDLDEGQAQVITALENLQREDLLPGDEARQYSRLLTALAVSQRELARRLGINHKRIARLMTIQQQAPQMFAAIDQGTTNIHTVLTQIEAGYYRGANLSQFGTESPEGGSAHPATPSSPVALTSATGTRLLAPEDFATPGADPEPRVHRHELLDPARSQQLAVAFKPAARFANYVSRLQPADVPPPDRVPLAERLEAAAQEASLLARALRQAAGEGQV